MSELNRMTAIIQKSSYFVIDTHSTSINFYDQNGTYLKTIQQDTDYENNKYKILRDLEDKLDIKYRWKIRPTNARIYKNSNGTRMICLIDKNGSTVWSSKYNGGATFKEFLEYEKNLSFNRAPLDYDYFDDNLDHVKVENHADWYPYLWSFLGY